MEAQCGFNRSGMNDVAPISTAEPPAYGRKEPVLRYAKG